MEKMAILAEQEKEKKKKMKQSKESDLKNSSSDNVEKFVKHPHQAKTLIKLPPQMHPGSVVLAGSFKVNFKDCVLSAFKIVEIEDEENKFYEVNLCPVKAITVSIYIFC